MEAKHCLEKIFGGTPHQLSSRPVSLARAQPLLLLLSAAACSRALLAPLASVRRAPCAVRRAPCVDLLDAVLGALSGCCVRPLASNACVRPLCLCASLCFTFWMPVAAQRALHS
jgi:hypothetical protein